MTPNNTFERTGKHRGCGSGSCPAAQLGRWALSEQIERRWCSRVCLMPQ
jgi:hypothetical protein